MGKEKIAQLQAELSQKDVEINQLKESLNAKGQLLREEEAKIEELRRQLESLGVFPK